MSTTALLSDPETTSDQAKRSRSPLAEGWEISTIQSQATPQVSLRYASYRNPRSRGAGPVKRWVVFFNGRTEWIEKYRELPDDLGLAADTGFLTLDHRGQGGSGGRRAHIDDYAQFADDAAQVVHHVTQGAPFVVLTHSMGGLIALSAVLKNKIRPAHLLMCSPLLGLPHRPLPPAIARPLAGKLTAWNLGGVSTGLGSFQRMQFDNNVLTQNFAMFKRSIETPYPIGPVTFGWVHATFAATDEILTDACLANLTMPTVIIYGSDERVVDCKAIEAWASKARAQRRVSVDLCLITNGRHELLAEAPDLYQKTLSRIRLELKDSHYLA